MTLIGYQAFQGLSQKSIPTKDEVREALLESPRSWVALMAKHPDHTWDLAGMDLTNRDLRDRDLSNTSGLILANLAGSDLTRASMPEGFDFQLTNITDASKNARILFITMLLGCVYCWLSIANTTDVTLILGSEKSKLPIIGVEVPTLGFFWTAPALLLGYYLYFHIYLSSMWDMLAAQPARFPDGQDLDRRVYPWIMTGLVRNWLPALEHRDASFGSLRMLAAMAMGWLAVPFTLGGLWFRCLSRHDVWLSSMGILVTVIGVFLGFSFWDRAKSILANVDDFGRAPMGGVIAAAVMVLALIFVLDLRRDRYTWIDADLRNLPTPEDWQGTAEEVAMHKGIELEGFNLAHADFNGAFLVKAEMALAVLAGAKLKSARLEEANLAGAQLVWGDLREAQLEEANLERAHLGEANLAGAQLDKAYLPYANLSGAMLGEALMNGANLREAILNGADLRYAQLNGSVLYRAQLNGTYLSGAQLGGADLREAQLNRVKFGFDMYWKDLFKKEVADSASWGVQLNEADLWRAELNEARLDFANLNGAILVGAELSGAILFGTQLDGAVLEPEQMADACLFAYTNLPWERWISERTNEEIRQLENLIQSYFPSKSLSFRDYLREFGSPVRYTEQGNR